MCGNFVHAGKWTVQQAADLGIASPTITASLDGRYMSALKPERMAAAEVGAGIWLNLHMHVCSHQITSCHLNAPWFLQ